MLFYIVLTVVCVVLAMVLLWLLRAISSVSESYSHGLLPSLNWFSRRRRAQRLAHLNDNLDASVPVPWGWGRGDAGSNRSSARPVNPPWSGSGTGRRDEDALHGWPHRHSREASLTRTALTMSLLGGKKTNKPWGW